MSAPVSHKGYEITSYPEHAVTPDILYLHVGEVPVAAAAATVGGWRVLLYPVGDQVTTLGSNVGDESDAFAWLEALGQLAAAAAEVAA